MVFFGIERRSPGSKQGGSSKCRDTLVIGTKVRFPMGNGPSGGQPGAVGWVLDASQVDRLTQAGNLEALYPYGFISEVVGDR